MTIVAIAWNTFREAVRDRILYSILAFALLLIGASYRRFGFRPYLALVYPLTLAIVMGIAVYSVVLALTGRSYWKGRQIARPKIRLW